MPETSGPAHEPSRPSAAQSGGSRACLFIVFDEQNTSMASALPETMRPLGHAVCSIVNQGLEVVTAGLGGEPISQETFRITDPTSPSAPRYTLQDFVKTRFFYTQNGPSNWSDIDQIVRRKLGSIVTLGPRSATLHATGKPIETAVRWVPLCP